MTHKRPGGPEDGGRDGFAAAKRSLGQNFLTDANIARKIVCALDIRSDDNVLEIGPGRGALTRHILAKGPRRLRLLEKDEALAAALAAAHPEVEVICGDALRYPWKDLAAGDGWKIIGNLPYNIASPLIWNMVGTGNFERAVCMVQAEVGGRLAAPSGGREYGALSVWVQAHAHVKVLFKVPPQVFFPRPKVTSSVVRFFLRSDRPGPEEGAALSATLKLCFQKRRKQLGTILKDLGIQEICDAVSENKIDLKGRPETLAPERFRDLAKILSLHFPA